MPDGSEKVVNPYVPVLIDLKDEHPFSSNKGTFITMAMSCRNLKNAIGSFRQAIWYAGPRTSELAADDIWRPRDLNQQIWAEERLRNLEFRKNVEENCTSFTRHFEDWVVYADPRQLGAISFFVYSSTQPEHRPDKPLRRFQLRDDWKHNLEEKLLTAIRTHDT